MLPRAIVSELNKRLPYLVNSYGGIDMFISYVKEKFDVSPLSIARNIPDKKYQEIVNFFLKILNFQEELFILSPWNHILNLNILDERTNAVLNDSINLERPYTVHNIEGDLLYTVAGSKHKGYFGYSDLDKDLINQSLNTDAYFLHYTDYEGSPKIKLIIINLHSNKIIPPNQLLKTIDNNQQNTIAIANYKPTPVTVYTLEDRPQRQLSSLSTIINLGTTYILESGTVQNLTPSTGTWLYIDTIPSEVNRTIVTYPDNDIIIPVTTPSPSVGTLYYIGTNIAVNVLNQTFNQSLRWSDKPINDIIELTSNI